MDPAIMLIDGNSIINRAFYAIPLLTNSAGEYTNAVYGFMNIFFRFFDEEKPAYAVVAFDVHAKTFRHEKYTEYKAGRRVMPEELRPQIALLKNLLAKMNIKTAELPGYEADDILGTLAARAEKAGLRPVIITGDRDLLQLAGEKALVRIPKTKSGKTEIENYYAKDIISSIGVTPREYIEVKALMGDASDNIPGVPGIGEKTAVKIIQEYKSVENAIASADKIKPQKAALNLKNFADQARLSRTLSEICLDVPIHLDFESCGTREMFNENARGEIARLEFKSLLSRFAQNSNTHETSVTNIISDVQSAENFLPEIMSGSPVSFFTCRILGKVFGIGMTAGGDKDVFFQINQDLTLGLLYGLLKPFFESDVPKVLLDSKNEILNLKPFGTELNNIVFDAMLAAYIINSSKNSYNYDDIAFDFLNESHMSLDEMTGRGKNKKSAADFTLQEAASYAIKNSSVIYRAYEPMRSLIKENNQDYLYYGIELPLARVLADMECTGIKADKKSLTDFGDSLDGMIERLRGDIYLLTGCEFNINSPSQLGTVLFETLKLKGSKKTKTGYSTSAEVLDKLRAYHPAIPKILEYRTYTKLKSTYADGLLRVINPDDSKIYSTFNQTVTTTGRISSAEPNLQNIPIRLDLGRSLRKVFVPADDSFIFMDADYSQIELRVMAHIAGDGAMTEAFKNGMDIHTITASQVFKTPADKVTDKQRSSAKAVNFGIIYGISGYSLGEDLNITKKEAQRYIDSYFETYPRIKQCMETLVESAREKGFAQTIYQRKRAIPEILSHSFHERAFGERAAMNMPVQGSAADIIKIAMVAVYKRLKENSFKSRIVLQVHDELLLEVSKDETDAVREILKEEMENCAELSVPLAVDIHEGTSWFEAK